MLGYTLLATGMVGVTWAESVNKFFEPSVRIQTDRGHRVIDGGPYAIVRHPGYVSGFFVFIGMPLCLGSLWALIPAVLLCMLLVVRTIWEDQTLRERAGRLRGVRTTSPISLDSWGMVIILVEPVSIGGYPGLNSGREE